MALISAKTILTSLSLFHITLAYFFFTNPETIAEQALVYLLGEAMGVPMTTKFSSPTPVTSLLAMILLLVGLSDILSLSLPEEIWLVHHWGAQAPLRFLFFAVVLATTWFTTPTMPRRAGAGGKIMSRPIAVPGTGSGGGWDGLRNRVVFTLAFMEMLSWFWVWVTLREEARALQVKKQRRRNSSGGDRHM
ncbi:hypothetical protein PG994_011808 [Apiospora phragmitis]|uniref:Increased loss of mitochondrial DNA protein 1 n=1 Tax=Apiospora phragmitis TaxID=2905665 RepID=A0ABR1TU48_9PEZI